MPGKRKKDDGSGRECGRCTVCTPELVEAICLVIASGSYIETAFAHAGVAKRTMQDWLRQGARDAREDRETIYRTCWESVTRAIAMAEVRNLETIREHGQGYIAEKTVVTITKDADGNVIDERRTTEQVFRRDWQAAAWRLERRHPERWGRRDTHLNIDGGKAEPAKIYMPERDELPEAVEQRRRALALAREASAPAPTMAKATDFPPIIHPKDDPSKPEGPQEPRPGGNGRNGGHGRR